MIALGRVAGILGVLGRRSVTFLDASGRQVAAGDLAHLVEEVRPVPRRPVGRFIGTGPEWKVWSTFLGEQDVFRLRLEDGGVYVEPAGDEPPEAPLLGIERGWPGPVVEIQALPALFHLDPDGHLVAEPAGHRSADPVGEPLGSAPSAGGWKIYVSAAALPGEPDRILEYAWTGSGTRLTGVSRPFEGRISALRIDGESAVIAVVDRPHHSQLVHESTGDLWSPELP